MHPKRVDTLAARWLGKCHACHFPLLTLVKRWMNNVGYYPVLVIFSQRNSPASEPGQRIFSVSPGTAGNRLDRWLSECLPAVSRARIQAVIRSAGASSAWPGGCALAGSVKTPHEI